MSETPIELFEYLTETGQNPFREWLEGLRDRFIKLLKRMNNGNKSTSLLR